MALTLSTVTIGPWPMNAYIILCENTGSCAVVDPGADPEKILNFVGKSPVDMILITHGHEDHIGALEEIREEIGAPVYIHPIEAELYNINFDYPFEDNGNILLGESYLKTIHTPGHTPGSTCIDLRDRRILVGDTVFVGGPGKTWSPEEFKQTLETMKTKVFQWSDDTIFYPGHGPSGRIGVEKPHFESFIARGFPENLFGDVTWE